MHPREYQDSAAKFEQQSLHLIATQSACLPSPDPVRDATNHLRRSKPRVSSRPEGRVKHVLHIHLGVNPTRWGNKQLVYPLVSFRRVTAEAETASCEASARKPSSLSKAGRIRDRKYSDVCLHHATKPCLQFRLFLSPVLLSSQ